MALRDIACEDCNAVIPMEINSMRTEKGNVWFPGCRCPICGSEKFFPVIAITETDRAQERQMPLKKRLLINPWTGVTALALTIVVVLVMVFWPSHQRAPSVPTLYYCKACHQIFETQSGAIPPIKCPLCSQRAAYGAVACTRCHLVYSYGDKRCPHCNWSEQKPLKTMKEVEEANRAHAEYVKQEEEAQNDENTNGVAPSH